jgi:hypothetical protein
MGIVEVILDGSLDWLAISSDHFTVTSNDDVVLLLGWLRILRGFPVRPVVIGG